MTRLLVLIALTVVAVGVAYLLQRRRPDAPSAPSYRAPTQLDRSDFDRPDQPILVVVFTSSTCESCRGVWELVGSLGRPDTVVQRIEVEDDPALHKRYRIDGVPTTLVVDPLGVVQQPFFGPVSPEELRQALPH